MVALSWSERSQEPDVVPQHFPFLLPDADLLPSLQRLPSPRRRPSSVVPRTTCRSVSLVCPMSARVRFSTSLLVAVRFSFPLHPLKHLSDVSSLTDLGKVANFP
jgi:hypothetical protein